MQVLLLMKFVLSKFIILRNLENSAVGFYSSRCQNGMVTDRSRALSATHSGSDADNHSIEDVYIAVTGITGAGKSEFICFCTDQEVVVGDGLISRKCLGLYHVCLCEPLLISVIAETSEVEDWTFMYNPIIRVHLIDTPGFDDTNKKDVEVLRDIAGWLGVTYKKKILLSGLIYLHPISDNRLRGSALRNLFMFKKLCGPECLRGIVLATTMWGLVNPDDGDKRENQLRSTDDFWGEMEKGGSRVMRHLRTKECNSHS